MKNAAEMIKYYGFVGIPRQWMPSIKMQYINMARGGDGGKLYGIEDNPCCREYNYHGYPDSFFQEVCDGMGWDWKDSQ